MSLQELMEQWQIMSDRRGEEDRARDKARLLEDMTFEGKKRAKLEALVVDVTARVPSYEYRSAGALRILEREQENEMTDLQRKHKAQLKALQKKQEEEMAALPAKYNRKAADIEKNFRMDIQWELGLMLEVEQSALENTMSVERRRVLEAREREDRIRQQARSLVDQDLNSQVLTTFREEASRHHQPHRDGTPQLSSQRPLKSILKKPRGISVNSDGITAQVLTSDDETLDDRKIKRVKVEGYSRSGGARAPDVLDKEATLFPYRENNGILIHTPRSPRTPWTPRTPRTPRTPQELQSAP
ncbi:hypothetical protein BKA65DRAFT_298181 [Rhexocercosporidium sp. MPI-PUGE-AT-0058]|nr:hypothetical protein BKA65DRAFT_298181 [Rhexocercosporidium sp. MPI-PUGE-AT-0058]